MPAALDVEWGAVKTHCVAHGIPDAAKRYGISQESIRQRCHREGWKDNPSIAEALVRVRGGVSRSVTNDRKDPAEIFAESVKDKLLRTRANHVETALIASADMLALAEETPSVFRDPEIAGVLLTHGKHAALAGGWASQAPTAKINLSVTGGNVSVSQSQDAPAMDAEWCDAGATETGESVSTDVDDY